MNITPKKITKEDLDRKFKEFIEDNTYLERVQAQKLSWLRPEFLVQLFVPDFKELSLLQSTNDFYKRYTGIAKILSVSNECAGRVDPIYATIHPGDIVYLGDDLLHVTVNHKWKEWDDHNGRGAVKGVEPIKYIRKFHRWMEAGQLYLVDRAKEVMERDGLEINLSTLADLDFPMIFRVPVQDVLAKIENPFA